jgi:hypothetical protein
MQGKLARSIPAHKADVLALEYDYPHLFSGSLDRSIKRSTSSLDRHLK